MAQATPEQLEAEAALAEVADEELVDVGDQKLALLDTGLTPIPVLANTLAEAAGDGERPHLRIDLTDPPSQPAASIGGIEATGASADEAMQMLAQTVSRAIRTARAADADPTVDPGPVVKGP